MTKDVMLRVFVSVATILFDWKTDILGHDVDEDGTDLEQLYAHTRGDHKNIKEAELLASCAYHLPHIETDKLRFHHEHSSEIMRSAPTVRKLAKSMMPYIMQYLDPSIFPDIERFLYELGARILIVAYNDLEVSKSGFFDALLGSVFARPMSSEAREEWEPYLGLDHKIAKDSLEDRDPFIFIHRAVLAYNEKWGLAKRGQADDRTLTISEPASDSLNSTVLFVPRQATTPGY